MCELGYGVILSGEAEPEVVVTPPAAVPAPAGEAVPAAAGADDAEILIEEEPETLEEMPEVVDVELLTHAFSEAGHRQRAVNAELDEARRSDRRGNRGHHEAQRAAGDRSVEGIAGHQQQSLRAGVGADPSDNSAPFCGAAYVFTRSGGVWSEVVELTGLDHEHEAPYETTVELVMGRRHRKL